MELFTNPAFAPFAISLYILFGLLAIELLLLVVGLGGSSFLDSFLPEFPEGIGETFSLSGIFHYFGFGKIPFVMLMAIFTTGFTAAGTIIQLLTSSLLGSPLPVWIAVLGAIAIAIALTRPASSTLGKMLNSEENTPATREQLIGRLVTITDGTATTDTSAAAKVQDHNNHIHHIYVKSFNDEEIFATGENATIVSIEPGFYLVSR